MVGVSVVIPVYNEEGNILQLHSELSKSLVNFDYELIFVNDGSVDNTQSLLEQIASYDNRIIIVEFRRNFGQSA
ncbi:MAG: glycosyltransferase, partial [Deltaproteobacteria bacterium]|nr:glycosyltransferase [Deltaproteobacteria bacterium]